MGIGSSILERWCWNGCLWMTLGKRDWMFIVQVSQDTDLFEPEELYSEGGFELARHCTVTLGRDSVHLLFRSSRTQLFELVAHYTWEVSWNDGMLGRNTREKFCTLIVQALLDTELFESVGLYLGDILKWQATLWWHWRKRPCTVDVVSEQSSFSQNIPPETGEEMCIFIIQVAWDTGLQVSIVLLKRWSWNDHSLVTLEERLHVHCSGFLGDSFMNLWSFTWEMFLQGKATRLWHYWERIHGCCCNSCDRALHVDGVIIGRWSQNVRVLSF